MRYIVLLIWTLLLSQLLAYVVCSMANIPYNYVDGIVIGVALWVVLSLISTVLPDHKTGQN